MPWNLMTRFLVLLAVAPLIVAASPSSVTPKDWVVDGKLYGKPKDGGQNAMDISGLACAPPAGSRRLCLIVDDESQGAQVVVQSDGRLLAGDRIPLNRDMFGNKPLELDAEGVSFADGFFYVVGSHGRPRVEEEKSAAEINARTSAARHLYRIDLSKAGVDIATGKLREPATVVEASSLLPHIQSDPRLAAADVPLDKNGLTIEGLAVRGDTMTLGFRGPTADGASILINVPLRTLFGAKPQPSSAYSLALGTDTGGNARGIRDLATAGDGLVGIAGPVNDPEDKSYQIRRGDYAVFWWDGHSAPVLRDLEGYGVKSKPEAIMPLKLNSGKLSALLLFDGPLNGMPTVAEINF